MLLRKHVAVHVAADDWQSCTAPGGEAKLAADTFASTPSTTLFLQSEKLYLRACTLTLDIDFEIKAVFDFDLEIRA